MDMSHAFWDDAPNMRHVKYESCSSSNDGLHQMSSRHGGNSTSNTSTTMLNFSTNDDESAIEYAAAAAFRRHSGTSLGSSQNSSQHLHQTQQQRVSRQDPLSHRIIEKRRRDRMNNCLADLSKLIPAEYLKKGRGRVEKTEIIEMAIKHMKHLQNMNHHRLGYQECMSEVMRFMVEVEGHFPREPLCVRLLSHLQQHCDSISMHGSIDLPIVYPSSTGLSNTSSPPPEPKVEPNNNNNNNNGTTNNNNSSETYESNAEEDQHLEEKHNTETYKYKNDIKLRFTQDLTCSDTVGSKRQKMVISGATGRRNSGASTENQSSGNSSPPRSDHCPRLLPSDGETVNTLRTSPSDSSISISAHNHHARNTHYHHRNRHSHHTNSISKLSLTNNLKSVSNLATRDDNSPLTNYTVPIFALHTKGAFYIPLTVDYGALLPYLPDGCDLATLDHHSSLILHPVAINVNFLPRKSGY